MKLEYGFQGAHDQEAAPSSASSLATAPGYPDLVFSYPELQFFESTRHYHLRIHAVILSSSPPLHLVNLYFRCKIRERFLWEPFLTLPGWVRFTLFVILQHSILLQSRPLSFLCWLLTYICLLHSTASSGRARTMLTCPSLCPST